MNRIGLIIFLFVAASAAALALWWFRPKPEPVVIVDRSEYRLEDYVMVSLDPQGLESFRVSGPQLYREANRDSMILENPNFVFPDPEKGSWNAQANRGWISPDRSLILLSGGVEMLGPAESKAGKSTLLTDSLEVFPQEDRAYTPDPVTITRQDSILQATGLSLDMKAKTYELAADVKAHVIPNKSEPESDQPTADQP